MSSPSNSILGKIKNAFLAGGRALVDAAKLAAEVLPFLSPFLPGTVAAEIGAGVGTLDGIAAVVTDTEKAAASFGTGATGSQKLAAAQPAVQQLVKDWIAHGLPGGKKVIDDAGFEKGCNDLTSAVVELLNAVGD